MGLFVIGFACFLLPIPAFKDSSSLLFSLGTGAMEHEQERYINHRDYYRAGERERRRQREGKRERRERKEEDEGKRA